MEYSIRFAVQMDWALSISVMALNNEGYCNVLRDTHKIYSRRRTRYTNKNTYAYILVNIIYVCVQDISKIVVESSEQVLPIKRTNNIRVNIHPKIMFF